MTLLSLEYGEMRVARLSRGKFIVGNIHGYVEKKNEKPPMTFNLVKSRGVSILKAQEPIG